MNSDSIIQVDFGHRSVDITLQNLRDWIANDDTAAACKAFKLKATCPADMVRGLLTDIAAATPGAVKFPCISCGGLTYGAEGVHGAETCTECDELAGWDNHHNDSGEAPTGDELAHYNDLLATIENNGGDPERVRKDSEYIW